MLKHGTLWTSVIQQTEHALKCGALQSIQTEYEFVEQNSIRFLVRTLSNLTRKDEAKKQQEKNTASSGKEFNPFLPYEPDLFVADISNTHICLLNKFNVVDYHLLIVTRAFEDQETLLNLPDFEALWSCMAEVDGFAFYNGGKIAGASQRHKHLQLVPLPIAPDGERIPIEPALASAQFQDSIGTIPSFPFLHALAYLDPSLVESPQKAAKEILDCYHTLLGAVGLQNNGNKQSGAYNLLATREWMLIVPRSQECFGSISVNSLGFAGSLLARHEQEMQKIKTHSPLNILKSVAVSINK